MSKRKKGFEGIEETLGKMDKLHNWLNTLIELRQEMAGNELEKEVIPLTTSMLIDISTAFDVYRMEIEGYVEDLKAAPERGE